MVRLPYAPRPGQQELADLIHTNQAAGGHLIVEAGTGTGKTVTALAASVHSTLKDDRRVLYVTRTNAQQAQVVAEHSAIQDAGGDPGLLIPLMGRRNYCPLLRSDERFRDGTPEELGRLCRDAKRKAQQQHQSGNPVDGACPYYARLLADGPEPVEALLLGGGLDGPALARKVEEAGSCTYEALKLLLPRARQVVAPLVYVLDDRLRRALFEWLGVGPDECHLVVDEAHHLPDAVREHHSPSLSQVTLTRAQHEAEEYQDPNLAGITLASSAIVAVMGALQDLADEYVRGEDGLVPPDGLQEALMRRMRLPTPAIERVAAELERWGDIIREDRRAKGRLPRSHLGMVGGFLRAWTQSLDAPYVHLVTGGDNPKLELYLLDPASVLGWLSDFRSTTHMSGTLAPIADHATQCGLPTATQRVVPSPFAPDHLRIVALEGVQRRFEAIQSDPNVAIRQQAAAREALAHCPGRTGLFFPSHQMLADYLEEGFLHGVGRTMFVERPSASTAELAQMVARFKAGPRDGLLLGVLGGRMSEGLDFPGETMEHMLVLGVPYPKPSARNQALIHHYDRVAGNGWQVAVHTPVGRVLRQAIGRLIRGPDDRGTAIILDDRAVRFHAHLPGLRMVRSPQEIATVQPASGDELAYRTADRWPRRTPPGAL